MLEACERVHTYVAGLSQDGLKADQRTVDAVLRNLEVLGEAAKRVRDRSGALKEAKLAADVAFHRLRLFLFDGAGQ